MFRIVRLSQLVLRSSLPRAGVIRQILATASHADTIYVGLGDRYDDDRRFVRDIPPR
jgi:hypothetical protein